MDCHAGFTLAVRVVAMHSLRFYTRRIRPRTDCFLVPTAFVADEM
jgi:hypothetical protein